jgi:hypothetical protein
VPRLTTLGLPLSAYPRTNLPRREASAMAHSQYSNLISSLTAIGISAVGVGLVLIILFLYERRRP